VIISQGSISSNFFAKRKVAGARRLAKNSPFNFTNSQLQNCEAKFKAKNSPNLCAIRQTPFSKKGVEFCARKIRAKMLMKSTPGIPSDIKKSV
jgi:hypothetical protein